MKSGRSQRWSPRSRPPSLGDFRVTCTVTATCQTAPPAGRAGSAPTCPPPCPPLPSEPPSRHRGPQRAPGGRVCAPSEDGEASRGGIPARGPGGYGVFWGQHTEGPWRTPRHDRGRAEGRPLTSNFWRRSSSHSPASGGTGTLKYSPSSWLSSLNLRATGHGRDSATPPGRRGRGGGPGGDGHAARAGCVRTRVCEGVCARVSVCACVGACMCVSVCAQACTCVHVCVHV